MARAATAGELTKLRSDGQKTDLFLTIHKPATVYTALVNQSTFTDPIAQITYDNGSGTLGNVKAGMTLYVGTSAGAYDLGMVRIRKAPSATVFYINEDSKIQWLNNAYLTVVDEIGLWQKHLVMIGSSVYMDYDISYSDQHASLAPVPVMGPHAVLWLAAGSVDFEPDASESWVLGSTISSYLWAAPGASGTADLDTAEPTITYDTAGTYRVSCTVTAANGKTTTGYRYVFVHDSDNLPATNFELVGAPTGSFDEGGWEFAVRMYDEADLVDVRDRAMVILHAKDWYGSEAGSIGPIAGYENIVAIGWIAGESIHQDPEYNYVDFEIRGANYWLNQIPGYPVGVEYSGTNPTVWTSMLNLTVDRGLFHLLHWRSTATIIMDITLPRDTQYAPAVEAGSGSLWSQIVIFTQQTILANAFCDRFGRLIIQVDTQYLAAGDRSSIPTVITLTQDDLREAVDWERETVDQVAQVEASGISYNGSKATPLISKAPGVTFTRFGRPMSIERLLIDDQTRLNEISGMVLANENNPYQHVDVYLAANNRLVDCYPPQYVIMSVGATDTVRGITLVNQKMIPRRVKFVYNADHNYLVADLECEAETIGTAGETVPYIPPVDPGILPWDLEDLPLPHIGPLPNPWQPPVIPPDPVIPPIEGEDCPTDAPANGPFPLYLTGSYSSGSFGSPGTYKRATSIACVLRGSGHDNPTYYEIKGIFQKKVSGEWVDTTDDAWYAIKAYNGSELVATGTHDAVTGNGRTRTGKFNYDGAITHITMEHTDVLHPGSVSASMYQGVGSYYTLNAGTLQWGFYGGGVFAIYQTTATAGEQHGADIAAKIVIPVYSGRTLSVTQAARVSQTGSSPSIQFLQGGYLESKTAWSIVWNESPYVSDALVSESYELTGAQNDIGIEIRVGEYSGGVVYTFSNQIYVFVNELYRLTVTSANIYNICEVGT